VSKSGAATTVIVAGGVLTALALIPAEGQTGSAYKKVWAAGLLTVALGVAADFVPEIVGPFAILVILAAVATNPGVLGRFVAGSAQSKPATAPLGSQSTSTSASSSRR
jgi:hypothetical protein